jgi:hypothetical protein
VSEIRKFESGATRDTDEGKLKYEGFLNPGVLRRFAEYMHVNRKMRDGSLRDPDNWQKGIEVPAYEDSLVRHVIELWYKRRCENVWLGNDTTQDVLCAIMFNSMGLLYESLIMTGAIQRGNDHDSEQRLHQDTGGLGV